jgi:O-methyltransferase
MYHMLSQFGSIIKLGLIHPNLMLLAIQIKRSHKTYLSYAKLCSLAQLYLKTRNKIPQPKIAEFGAGRGGSAMILAWMINRFGGQIALFDVFGRIPPPSFTDGEEAIQRYRVILEDEGNDYYGNMPDLLETIKREINTICPLNRITFYKGLYEDTLCTENIPLPFDFVHIDCDWYESAKVVLSFLEKNLSPGAIIQVDDYYYWPGAQKAVDEAQWLQGVSKHKIDNALVFDTSQRVSV